MLALLHAFLLKEVIAPAQVQPGAPPVPTGLYLSSTYGLFAITYGIAVFVPSIWDVISFVGAVACTIMCFIIPAALILRYKDHRTLSHTLQRGAAWLVAALGVGLFLNIFIGMYLSATRQHAQPPSQGLGEQRLTLGAVEMKTAGADSSVMTVWQWAGWGA